MGLVAGVAVAAVWASGAGAQVKASEAATMSQTIDGTVVRMEYSRPSLRGRIPFGDVVHWGKRWTPGANHATTFEVNRDVHVDGTPVPAGRYSLWMDVVEGGPWRLIFEPDTELYHTQPPADADDQIVVEVAPEEGVPMDALLWYFASVRHDGGELRMHWGRTVASFDVAVEPTRRLTITPDEAAVVAGAWTGTWLSPSGDEGPAFTFTLTRDDASGLLAGRMVSAGQPEEEGGDVILLPMAEQVFSFGWGQDGRLWEETELLFEFTTDGGERAVAFEARDGQDNLVARGRRGDRAGS